MLSAYTGIALAAIVHRLIIALQRVGSPEIAMVLMLSRPRTTSHQVSSLANNRRQYVH
jgi:hypothetical protein